MKTKLSLLALSLFCAWSHAGEVIGISDGDTLTVLQDGKPLKVRLASIDAPEKAQDFGEKSKQSLSELCYRKEATLAVETIDRYGRTVATVTCAGVNANRAQIERGLAWVYTKYNKDASLTLAQTIAKDKKAGLWSMSNPVPPWDFRRSKVPN